MNKPRALKALSGRLKFRDQVQIEAVRWLQIAAILEVSDVEVEKKCPKCEGTGRITCGFDPDEDQSITDLQKLAMEIEEAVQ